jgi:type I restriction enzyme S subunit
MSRLIYDEWFIKFRFPGYEKAKIVETDLGLTPEGWDLAKIGDISTVDRGRSYRGSEIVEDGGLPFLNLKCIGRDGGLRHDGIKRFIGPFKSSQTATPGDVIIAVTDMTQERRLVARPARVPRMKENLYVFSMDLVKVSPKEGVPGREYLYSLLRFSSFGDEVKQHANGVNVLHLNPERILDFRFRLPSADLRAKFTEIVSPMFNSIDTLALRNSNLRQTRDLLLPKLISGELNVENFDVNLPAENGAAVATSV